MALSLAACGGGAAATSSAAGSTSTASSAASAETTASGSKDLVIGCAVDIVTLDPGRAYELYAGTVINACYDTLFRLHGNTEPVNDLATGYEFSEDGLTCTIKLVDNATFSSGNPVTSSKDVAFSLMRLKNLQDNPAFIMDSVDSIETPDDTTAVFHLNQPDASLIAKLTGGNSNHRQHSTSEQGATDAADAATADTATSAMDAASYGSGLYVMTKYSADEEIVMERNESYWGETVPAVILYTIQVMDDANTQMMALTQGDIDIAMNLNNDTVEQLGTDGSVLQAVSQP